MLILINETVANPYEGEFVKRLASLKLINATSVTVSSSPLSISFGWAAPPGSPMLSQQELWIRRWIVKNCREVKKVFPKARLYQPVP